MVLIPDTWAQMCAGLGASKDYVHCACVQAPTRLGSPVTCWVNESPEEEEEGKETWEARDTWDEYRLQLIPEMRGITKASIIV